MKKTLKKSLHPSLALALVAVIAPLIFGQVHNSLAASEDSPVAEPKSTQFWRFDPEAFRESVRSRRKDGYSPAGTSPVLRPAAPAEPSPSSAPASSSSLSSSESQELSIDDLTGPQLAELRRQLRRHVCPQTDGVLLEYRKLCEKLLRMQGYQGPKTGLRNSEQ